MAKYSEQAIKKLAQEALALKYRDSEKYAYLVRKLASRSARSPGEVMLWIQLAAQGAAN